MKVRINKLPSNYQELEYIQSTGEQHILLPTIACTNWIIDYQFVSNTTEGAIISNANSSAPPRFELFCSPGITHHSIWSSVEGTTESTINYYTRVIVDCMYTAATTGVIKINHTTFATKTLPQPRLLFAYTTSNYKSCAKLYSFKANGINGLLINLVPCRNKSNNTLGLYDTINQTFYTNQGTGDDFIAGPEIRYGKIRINSDFLPSAYQRVDYIQSSGDQYIDSGVVAKNDVGWKIDYAALSYTESNIIIGAGTSDNATRCWVNDTTSGTYAGWNTSANLDESKSVDRKTIKINYKNDRKVYLNDVEKVSGLEQLTVESYNLNLYLFADNYNTLLLSKAKSKLYDLEITSGQTVIRHFIPCYRKSDSKPGLYDLVNGVFYVNQGTGTDFTYGSEIHAGQIKGERIPSTYQRLEYLESTGTQWIDTGYNPNQNTKVQIDAIFGTRTDQKLYGYRVDSSTTRHILLASNGGTYYLDYGTGAQVTTYVTIDSNRHIFTLNKNETYIDNVLKNRYTAQTFSCGNAYLFACNQNGTVNGLASAKLYSCKIYENDVLVRDFIPARRLSDNKPGLYNTVSGQFYTNSATSGDDFIAGPEIN